MSEQRTPDEWEASARLWGLRPYAATGSESVTGGPESGRGATQGAGLVVGATEALNGPQIGSGSRLPEEVAG